jgi:hypothetical protein
MDDLAAKVDQEYCANAHDFKQHAPFQDYEHVAKLSPVSYDKRSQGSSALVK